MRQYVNYFKRKFKGKKEFRLTIFYSLAYFIFITALLLFGTTARGETSGIVIKAEKQVHGSFVKPISPVLDSVGNSITAGNSN